MKNMQNKTRKKKDGRKMEKSISDIRNFKKSYLHASGVNKTEEEWRGRKILEGMSAVLKPLWKVTNPQIQESHWIPNTHTHTNDKNYIMACNYQIA